MKKIIMVAIILSIGWYGNYLYKQHGLAFFQGLSNDLVDEKEVKCITKDGSVIYGSVPHGTICAKVEPIEGSLTVVSSPTPDKENRKLPSFRCDGRTYCSQMTSCEEATFFLRNCPNVKMDGNNDGVPCEKQWCR